MGYIDFTSHHLHHATHTASACGGQLAGFTTTGPFGSALRFGGCGGALGGGTGVGVKIAGKSEGWK